MPMDIVVDEFLEGVEVGRPDYSGRQFFIDTLQLAEEARMFGVDGEDEFHPLRLDNQGRIKLSAEIPEIDIGAVSLKDEPGGIDVKLRTVTDEGYLSTGAFGIDEDGTPRTLQLDTQGRLLSNIRRLTDEDILGQINQIDNLGYDENDNPRSLQITPDGKLLIEEIADTIEAEVGDVQDILNISALSFTNGSLDIFNPNLDEPLSNILSELQGVLDVDFDNIEELPNLSDIESHLSDLEVDGQGSLEVVDRYTEDLPAILSRIEEIDTKFDEDISTLRDRLEEIRDETQNVRDEVIGLKGEGVLETREVLSGELIDVDEHTQGWPVEIEGANRRSVYVATTLNGGCNVTINVRAGPVGWAKKEIDSFNLGDEEGKVVPIPADIGMRSYEAVIVPDGDDVTIHLGSEEER